MNKEEIKIICDTEDLYETCENMEQLFDYYLTLNIDYQKIKQENKQLKERIDNLKDELIKDRMEQFDDYVIYLLNKYLEMLGDSNE